MKTLLLLLPLTAHAERFVDINCSMRVDVGGAVYDAKDYLAWSPQNGFGNGANSGSMALEAGGVNALLTATRDPNVVSGFLYRVQISKTQMGRPIDEQFIDSTVVRPLVEGNTQIVCKVSG